MKGSGDLTELFRDWEFDPDNQVRIIRAKDGRQVLQVRQPLGIEQYEMDGRPDGKRPFDKESVLQEFEDRLKEYIELHGEETGFRIGHEEFLLLQNEGVLNYYRYLILFQIADFARTTRDTEHNLRICDLVERFVESEEDRKELLQYRPYILRMNAIAKAMISLHQEMKTTARQIIESAIEEIEKMPEIDTPAFQFERIRSLNYLRSTLRQVLSQKTTLLDQLKGELEEAIQEEDYEKAAELRDRIRGLHRENEL
jgi:hypothetical protein